jgi:tetratricopeptide (TPR) repeat protein
MSEHEIWNEFGNIYFHLGAYDQAVCAYTKALSLDDADGWTHNSLALAHANQCEYVQAIAHYQRSIELLSDPKGRALVWSRLGNVYELINDYENSISAYQNAVELDPENFDSDILPEEDDGETEADPVSDNAPPVEIDLIAPEPAPVVEEIPVAEIPIPAPEAEPVLEEVVATESAEPIAIEIVIVEDSASLPTGEWSLLEEPAPELPAESEPVAEATAEAFMIADPVAELAEDEEPLSESDPLVLALADNPIMSDASVPEPTPHKSHLDDAVVFLKEITQVAPMNDGAWDTLGNLFRASGCYDEAIAAFEQAISLEPNNEEYYYHIGLVFAMQERNSDAIDAFIRAVEINPAHNLAHCALAGHYRKLGMDAESMRHIKLALPAMMSEREYSRACFEAVSGNIEHALDLLKIALDKKQITAAWARRDPDLDFIRADPRFSELMSGAD